MENFIDYFLGKWGNNIETPEEEAQRIKEEANDERYDYHPRPEEENK